ncbi:MULTISPECIES: efflux transporter outer membrane subunit [unclassified Undibacterium]|uniref:efflux transporter outer membrane subunit n=1 Tax=unclassified Undibacterium TaxID=2630295 RepID=UPI002AC96F35|nr:MULTISPECIES: efflux transporter outer membrane subunit [unclassified Undibacterium]MEB0140942.1 efflux transporter outer membrane subunit [Undibacterium sp. CCC2.1]MEB0173943.1 efflux transporter outer membrane subunit [Undibacterium sp. CCC1.1]MEB0177166.1 efflux transporter outer membrane subunit [Undibacterium sp. CCC3.4]MEB0217112.1 efflux transporter outer membrane subunit [Undibacterium sp. 5I2]WPX43162.1 efflux transporter outer membrane subunit [Undibacterium sp. CCC3.4]
MKKFLFRPNLAVTVLALSLSACAIGPDYHKPAVPLAAAFKEDGRWKSAEPLDILPRGAWWEVYQDARLNGLMLTQAQASPSIAQAEAQYRQTQQLLAQAEASLFPSLTASAGSSRTVSAAGAPVTRQSNLNLSASWELDMWGSVRRAIEAGEAKQASSAAQLAAIKLSAQAQLVSAYLQLVVSDKQLEQLRSSEAALSETVTLTRNQYRAGTVSEASLNLADSQYQSARAATLDKQLQLAQLEHAVAAAIGVAPADFSLPAAVTVPHLPQLPALLPSALLERRPDIAVAERNMAQANAQIGLAEAAFFPSLSLTASGGYKGTGLSDLLSAPNRIWAIGPQLAATVFDAGLRKAQTAQAVAVYDASVAAYRLAVLAAFQNVEDTLVAQSLLEQQAQRQTLALVAAQRAETITRNQYAAGTVAYLNVLAAQTTRISAEANLWTVLNRQYTNSVALIAALGGRW